MERSDFCKSSILMISYKVSMAVTPAKAGVHNWLIFLDSRLRGTDENGGGADFLRVCQYSIINQYSILATFFGYLRGVGYEPEAGLSGLG